MTKNPSTTQVLHELFSALLPGEQITSKDCELLLGQGFSQGSISGALHTLSRGEKPYLLLVGKTGHLYIYKRTEFNPDFTFKTSRPGGTRNRRSNYEKKMRISSLEMQRIAHDGKYLTSIGW